MTNSDSRRSPVEIRLEQDLAERPLWGGAG